MSRRHSVRPADAPVLTIPRAPCCFCRQEQGKAYVAANGPHIAAWCSVCGTFLRFLTKAEDLGLILLWIRNESWHFTDAVKKLAKESV